MRFTNAVGAMAEEACGYVDYFYSHAMSASGPYVYESSAGDLHYEPRYRGDTIRVFACA